MLELIDPFLVLKYLAAVLSLFVPGYAVLVWLDRQRTCVSGRGVGGTIAYSLVISSALLTVIPLILGMLNMSILRQFYSGYLIVSVVLMLWGGWRLVRCRFEPVKAVLRKWSNAAMSRRVSWVLVFLLLVMLAVTCVGYPKMNWDGFNFYLRDAGIMLETNSVPYYCPTSLYPVKTSFAMNSLFGSTLYAYVLSTTGLLDHATDLYALVEGTNLYLGLIGVIFLMCASLMAGMLACEIFKRRVSISAVMVLSLVMPFVVEYAALTSLAVDAFFCFFVVVVAYSAVKIFKGHAEVDWAMLAVALFLTSVTKVIGIYVGLIITGAVLALRLGRKTRLAAVVLVCVSALAFLYYRMTRDEWTSAGLSPAYSLLAVLAFILLACACLYVLRAPSERKVRLPGSGVVWAILGLVMMVLVAYFIRATVLTGSPFMYYQPLYLGEDARWGVGVVSEAELYRPWVGAFPGVPQLYPVSILVGYFVCAHLSLFLCLSVWRGLQKRESVIGVVNLVLIGAVLSWILVFGMMEPRHIFWVTPFLAISYVYGIEQLSGRLTEGDRDALPLILAMAVTATAPLMLVANLYIYGYDNGSLSAVPGWLKWFSGFDGWFTGWNIFKACAYTIIVTGLVVVVGVWARHVAKNGRRLAVVERWASVVLVVLFLAVLCITNGIAISRYDSVGERESLYDGMDNGIIGVISEMDRQHMSGGTILCFWGWGVEYLTRFRFGYVQFGEPVEQIGGMRAILQLRGEAGVSRRLDELDVKYALFPSEGSGKRAVLERLGETASADLLENVEKYFEPTDITSGPDGWTLYRRTR